MFVVFGVVCILTFLILFVMYDRSNEFKWWKPLIQSVFVLGATLFLILNSVANHKGIEVIEDSYISSQLEIGTSIIYFDEPVEITKFYIEYPSTASKTSEYSFSIEEYK